MYRLMGIVVFIALGLLTECQVRANGSSSEELIPQIKLKRAEVPYIDPEYFNVIKFNINKHNATYNKAHLDFELIQDLPPDTVLNINVYATNAEYEKEKLILRESMPLCKDSNKRLLWKLTEGLPKFKQNECIKKGKYSFDDSGSFRFDLEIPNIHEISDYQYTRYELWTKNKIINEIKWYTEWGYLNTA